METLDRQEEMEIPADPAAMPSQGRDLHPLPTNASARLNQERPARPASVAPTALPETQEAQAAMALPADRDSPDHQEHPDSPVVPASKARPESLAVLPPAAARQQAVPESPAAQEHPAAPAGQADPARMATTADPAHPASPDNQVGPVKQVSQAAPAIPASPAHPARATTAHRPVWLPAIKLLWKNCLGERLVIIMDEKPVKTSFITPDISLSGQLVVIFVLSFSSKRVVG